MGAKEAANHQADANAASARGTFSFDLVMPGVDWSDIDHGLSDSDHGYDDEDEYKDDYDGVWDDETTCFKFSTTTTSPTTTETSDAKLITTHRGTASNVRGRGWPHEAAVYCRFHAQPSPESVARIGLSIAKDVLSRTSRWRVKTISDAKIVACEEASAVAWRVSSSNDEASMAAPAQQLPEFCKNPTSTVNATTTRMLLSALPGRIADGGRWKSG